MIKLYVPNTSAGNIGGGWSFLRNFKKALQNKVEFVDRWQDCDIIFAFSITTMDKTEVSEAINAGKKFCLRCDNIPRKSRNRRQSPAERLKEFGELADAVVYQSMWAKEFAGYFAGDGTIIYNGVDLSCFNLLNISKDNKTYLYINYNDNPNKRFDEAIYRFEMDWRQDNERHLIIAGTAPRIYLENPEYNWDLNITTEVEYAGIIDTPEAVAELMKTCDFLLYPSFAEAAPNTIAEAMACGMKPLYMNPEGGTIEMYNLHKDKPYTIEQMGDAYLEVFKSLTIK